MAQQRYPDNWDVIRRKVYTRDDYTCQICGDKGGKQGNTEVHAHHVTPLSEGGSNKMNNLVTLCDSCHNNQHTHDITASNPKDSAEESGFKTALIAIGISIVAAGMVLVTPNLLFDIFGSLLGFLMFPILILGIVISGAFGVTRLLIHL